MTKIFKNRTIPSTIQYKGDNVRASDVNGGLVSPYEYYPTVDFNTALFDYMPTEDSRVKATSTNVTFTKIDNKGTFSIPLDTIIDACMINGDSSDVIDNEFEVEFVHDELEDYNVDILTYNPPIVSIMDTSLAAINLNSPSDSYAVEYITYPEIKITLLSEGTLKVKIVGLEGINNWTIKFNL